MSKHLPHWQCKLEGTPIPVAGKEDKPEKERIGYQYPVL
jgi:hypothetical protein